MGQAIHLRDAQEADLPFLFSLYCNVREPEVSAWGWSRSQRESFLQMQFDAQRRSYQAAYPGASNAIVLSGETPIGRMLAAQTLQGTQLIDIALLAEYRNRGVGAELIRALMADCERSGSFLSLQVLNGSPARRLYRRLGFHETELEAEQMYVQMQWTPAPNRDNRS